MKLLALISLLGSLALLANAYLTFSPTSLTLTSDLAGGFVQVRLAARPPRTVAVYFDAPKTRFDRCSLTFTPDNWATPQTLRVVSEPYATLAVAERQVPITFQAYSEDCNWSNNGKTVTLPTVRDAGCAGRCAVTGDPHFDMFDLPGTYHFQAEGDFYYVRSDILTIQARQRRCFDVYGRPTCIIGLGIRYGSAVFIIDGTVADINAMVQAVTHTNGVTISRSRSGSVSTFNLAFNSGSTLKIDIVQGGVNTYSNVYINLGTYLRGRTAGLCGTFDGNGVNDFTASSGQIFSHTQVISESNADPGNVQNFARGPNLKAFGESWRVPPADNIFAGVRTANKLPLDVTINQCLRPDPSSVKCTWADPEPCLDSWQTSWAFVQQGTRLRRAVIPGASTNSTCGSSSAVVPDPIVVAPVPPGFQAQAQVPKFTGKAPEVPTGETKPVNPPTPEEIEVFAKLCREKIGNIEGCTQDQNKYITSCQVDIRMGVHPEPVWNMQRLAYADACKEQLMSLAQDADEKIAENARALARAQALGNSPCDPNCKQCTDVGCVECKQPKTFEIKNGKCVVRAADEPKPDNSKFGELPSTKILSRNEIAPPTTGKVDNPAINTNALVQQALGSGPTKLV